jgi:bile acid-coenzyme A ligase
VPAISFARRLADFASADPDRPAITCGAETVTRAELESRADALARDLAEGGVGVGSMVSIALANSVARA